MPIIPLLIKAKDNVLKSFSGDMSKMFIATTIIGYLSSAAGQLYGVSKNDKLDKDKKKFLRFQELADCSINIVAYFLITKNITKLTKWLASSGKILSKGISEGCEKCGIKLDEVKNIGTEISGKLDELNHTTKVLKDRKITIDGDAFTKITNDIEALKTLQQDKYVPFESGMSMLGTITGGLISSSFIAPVLRNKYASAKKNSNAEMPQITVIQTMPKSSMKI